MNTTIVYGFYLTVCLAMATAMTSTATQSTLMVLTVSSGIAFTLMALIERSRNRAQRKARHEYVTRYGEDPWREALSPARQSEATTGDCLTCPHCLTGWICSFLATAIAVLSNHSHEKPEGRP